MKKIDWLIIVGIFILSIFLLKDLLRPGYFTSHDGIHQVVRLYYFDQAVKDGQIPPRWGNELLNGYGYPLYSFSYHLPWIIAEPIHLSGLSIIDSIKSTFFIGFILSGVTMYLFQKQIFNRWSAFVGTCLYLIAPYRFSNIFVRAAIGDATSFIFPPLLFLAAYKIRNKKVIQIWPWICVGAVAIAGLVLSHAMVFLFFAFCYLLYVIFWMMKQNDIRKYIFHSLLVLLFGLALSGYYFIPSLIERNYTRFNEIMRVIPLGKTYLNMKDIIYSSWGYGTMDAVFGKMSFQFGIAQWSTLFIFIVISVFSIFKKDKKKYDNKNRDSKFYLFLLLISIFLVLPYSQIIWNIINKIAYIDLVWRVFAVSVFAVSVMGGFIIYKSKWSFYIGIFLIILALYANRNHLRRNETLDWPESFYLQLELTTNSFDEYVPQWVDRSQVKKRKLPFQFSEEDAHSKFIIYKTRSNIIDFSVQTPLAGIIRLNKIYYPGWNAYVDGYKVPIEYNSGGFMQVRVPSGLYHVLFKFGETPLRLFSDMLSIAAFIILIKGLMKFKSI